MRSSRFNANVVAEDILESAIWALRRELGITSRFPDQAWEEAKDAARAIDISQLPDRRDIRFVTIDPEGARDLDQALHIEREGSGYLVRYAIAAVSLFVKPGGVLDREVHRRGVTVYLPDRAIPLHPVTLSANAASLLPNVDRPAYLWYLHVGARGELVDARVELAQIRSRAQLTYSQVQAAYDDGGWLPRSVPADMPQLLQEVGDLREQCEIERGGVSLALPEQRIVRDNGGYRLAFRELTAVERWNAQISLLTGMAAAQIMLDANIGIVRTLPRALERDVDRLRRVAQTLGLDWPPETEYADFIRSLGATSATELAFLHEATMLFRGAGYLALPIPDNDQNNGESSKPLDVGHAAIGAPYAHVTAPLRRLVDRYALEVCRCLCSGQEIPQWVRQALPKLPAEMATATQKAGRLQKRAVGAAEALTLVGREGERFRGTIIDVISANGGRNGNGGEDQEARLQRGVVLLREPAVSAKVTGLELVAGQEVTVELVAVDTEAGRVTFQLVNSQ
ncbi:MAG: RNB domain-containing ribonuclease [Actinomycetaceae bacterium]|nr:RNB domain-containing ribonuclease [Actinomycetaceae bacterium]